MSSSRRSCLNNPNSFCYVCGEYTLKKFRKPISEFVQNAYFAYFNLEIKDIDKTWTPNNVCKMCTEHLRQWINGQRSHLKCSVPMIWKEPKNHYNDCYFCLVKVHGINPKKMTYPDLVSARRPIPHSEDISATSFCDLSDCEDIECSTSDDSDSNDNFEGPSSKPVLFTQAALNDLIRDLDLSKERSELLASRLKERNLLSTDTKITYYRSREKNYFRCSAQK
ncbi:hypothetical protein TcasGA2_TC005054 [Tribolium castaneum]|uniref:Uncharacterized protein n=1 Tax=Tribolium castaneum TaxID=7070 RepID=D7GXQ6_TRICA|nr:hypothetical protein TcasGA2_TC005054 [Tribolium castaneum]